MIMIPVTSPVKTGSEHVHEWKRLPVVTLSVTYWCPGCDRAVTVSWMGDALRTLYDVDAHFVAAYGDGGVFAGEAFPLPR